MFASKPYIAAAMWFALQDFPAKPGWSGGDPFPHPPFVMKGAIDLQGNPVQRCREISGWVKRGVGKW